MFNLSFKSDGKKKGLAYILLNVIRGINIIALLTVVIGSWIMLVRTVQNSNFFFFDGVSHFITSTIGIFLVISELSIFKSYFEDNWPLLSESHGFLFLGTSMMVLGFNILGNLNKPEIQQDVIGLPFWRVVIAGGILTSIMGPVNVIASLIFKDRKSGVSARQVRAFGAAPPQDTWAPKSVGSDSVRSNSTRRPPSLQLPSYHANTEERRKSKFGFMKMPIRTSHIGRPVQTDPEQFKEWESRSSPIVPDVQRPATALHPAYSPSRYSVASRF